PHVFGPATAVRKPAPLCFGFGPTLGTAAIRGALARACDRLTPLGSFLMSGRGTPLPTEGRLSGRVDHEPRDARRAAGRSALLLRPLCQASRLEPLSPHRRRS